MSASVTSTKAKTRDPEQVRVILDGYELEGVEFDLRQEGPAWVLQASYHEPDHDLGDTPTAVRSEDWPDEDVYPDEDAYFDAADEIRSEKGDEGFLALLRELAGQLESPLLILSVSTSRLFGPGYAGQTWRVEPDAKQVETAELSVDCGTLWTPQPEAASTATGRHCLSDK